MKRVCLYGSLRLNEYNYNYFKARYGDNMHYIKTIELEGYKLYSLGLYPGIKESKNNEVLIADIMDVSEDLYWSITEMELSSGYSIKEITIDDIKTSIFIYKGSVSESKLVVSGDWSNYLKENKQYEVIR